MSSSDVTWLSVMFENVKQSGGVKLDLLISAWSQRLEPTLATNTITPWMYYKSWIHDPKMAPIRSNKNCSGTYIKKVYSVLVTCGGVQLTEYTVKQGRHGNTKWPWTFLLILHMLLFSDWMWAESKWADDASLACLWPTEQPAHRGFHQFHSVFHLHIWLLFWPCNAHGIFFFKEMLYKNKQTVTYVAILEWSCQ